MSDAPLVVLAALREPGAVVDAATLSALWSRLDRPEAEAPPAWWIATFRSAGYTLDGAPTPRPTTALRLYRGADWHRTHGMAWTTSRPVALRFATQDDQRSARGRLWTTSAPPAALLARIGGPRHEEEVVLDPAMLAAVEADDQRPPQRRGDVMAARPWSAPFAPGSTWGAF